MSTSSSPNTTWTRRPLSELVDFLSGGTPPKQRLDFWTGSIPWVSPKDVKKPFLHDTQDHLSESGVEAGSRLAPAKTVFVVVRGMALAKDVPVALGRVPMAFNQDIKALIPRRDIEPEFLLFALKAHKAGLMKEVGTAAHGTRRMGSSTLEDFTIDLPGLTEQRSIAKVLSTLHATIDVEQSRVAALRELKAATMAKLFREGLRGERLKRTETGEIPESWATTSLEECAVIQTGIAKGKKASPGQAYVEMPYLRVANVQDGFLDLTEIKKISVSIDEANAYHLQKDDVLLTEGGDFDKLGRGYIWADEVPDCLHQNHIFAVRTDRQKLLPHFFAYQAQSPYGKAYFLRVAHKTTNLACINTAKLKAFPALLPDLDEQSRIATVLAELDIRLRAAARRLATTRALFDSTLHLLMSGQVRVSEAVRS